MSYFCFYEIMKKDKFIKKDFRIAVSEKIHTHLHLLRINNKSFRTIDDVLRDILKIGD